MPKQSSRSTPSRQTEEPAEDAGTMTVPEDYDRSAGNPAAQPADDPIVPQPSAAAEADPGVDPDAKTIAPESQADYYSAATGSDQG